MRVLFLWQRHPQEEEEEVGGVADHPSTVGWARSAHLIGSCCASSSAWDHCLDRDLPLAPPSLSKMTEQQYQQQQQVNLGHLAESEVTSVHHKPFLVGPVPPLHSGQQQQQLHPSAYLASQHSYNPAANMTNGTSSVYGYDTSPDCGYYEQECSGADANPQHASYRSCAMQMAVVNSPVSSVPIQQQQQQNNHPSDIFSPSPYHLGHHLGQQHPPTQTVHHFSASTDELSADVIGKFF